MSNDAEMNSDNESSEEEDDAEIQKKLGELNERLEVWKGQDYEAHLAKVDLLRSAGELDQLREAREAFHKAYPLSPPLWKAWLEDEMKLCETEDDKARVTSLFDRAVGDYLSVDLWYEYVSFSLGGLGVDPDVENRVRLVFERALAAVGLHCGQAAVIWDDYR